MRCPAELIEKRLHTTAAALVDYWRMSALGGVMSGSIGVQGHYANGLAALFIACGQDAACVAEAAVGVTRFEPIDDGGLYASVTLPNLIVGTVGGGTGLPTQRACLEIMGLAGDGGARAFAEVAAAHRAGRRAVHHRRHRGRALHRSASASSRAVRSRRPLRAHEALAHVSARTVSARSRTRRSSRRSVSRRSVSRRWCAGAGLAAGASR